MLRILILLLLSSRAFACEVKNEDCEFRMDVTPEVVFCRKQFPNHSSSIISALSGLSNIDDKSLEIKDFRYSKDVVEKNLAGIRNCENIDFPFFRGEMPDYRSFSATLPYVILYLESAIKALDMGVYSSSSYNQRLWREQVEGFVTEHKS